jgi:hypothetical protein
MVVNCVSVLFSRTKRYATYRVWILKVLLPLLASLCSLVFGKSGRCGMQLTEFGLRAGLDR